MQWKRLIKALLFPYMAVLLLLLPLAVWSLAYGFLFLPETHPLRIGSYVLSFYTLTVWCLRVPGIIRCFKAFRQNNPYVRRWLEDVRLRMRVTLTANVVWNGTYALLQLGLGICHSSFWFYSLAIYYGCLAGMRFFLARYTALHTPGGQMRRELIHYRRCGWAFLVMNLALSGMMLYMIRENRIVKHNEITTIAMAAYTFTSLTMAIVNVIRYRRYNSPVFSASKAVSLAAGCVSLLTLEGTMLTTFHTGGITAEQQILFLGLTGGAVSAFIITMAVFMIVTAKKKLDCLEKEYGK